MKLVVFGYKMVSYQYFMDEMKPYELQLLIDSISFTDINGWEQTRLKMYTTASLFAKKGLKTSDIMQFSWDGKEDEPPKEITQTDIDRLKARAKLIQKQLTNNGSNI